MRAAVCLEVIWRARARTLRARQPERTVCARRDEPLIEPVGGWVAGKIIEWARDVGWVFLKVLFCGRGMGMRVECGVWMQVVLRFINSS